ncbi:MAG: S41 family peptidase [Pseudomonadota bacterium]
MKLLLKKFSGIGLILLTCFISLPGHGAIKEPLDYWKKIPGMAFWQLQLSFLNDLRCSAPENSYLACVTSLNAILRLNRPRLMIIPKEPKNVKKSLEEKEIRSIMQELNIEEVNKAIKERTGKVIQENEDYALVELLPDQVSSKVGNRELARRYNEFQVKLFNAWRYFVRKADLYRAIVADPVTSFIKREMINKDFTKGRKKIEGPENKPESKEDKEKKEQEQQEREIVVTVTGFDAFWTVVNFDHARVEPLKFYEDLANQSTDEYAGLGISLLPVTSDKGLIVLNVSPHSPAEQAGIRSYDYISKVNNLDLREAIPSVVIGQLEGEVGSKVNLEIFRDGKTFTTSLTRVILEKKNVDYHLAQLDKEKIGYIQLHGFMADNSASETRFAIMEMEKAGAKGLILDLRDNGGGQVKVAEQVASLFLGPKQLVFKTIPVKMDVHKSVKESRFSAGLANSPASEEASDNQLPKGEEVMTKTASATMLPLAIIVNANSASASEILAGTLADHGRAYLVGDTTFGKGTMQSGLKFMPGVIMFWTLYMYQLPSGMSPQLYGLGPHLEVPHLIAQENGMKESSLREEDYALHPVLPPGNKKVQYTLNPQLKNCVDKKGQAKNLYKKPDIAQSWDYQYLKSLDLLGCIIGVYKD